MQPDSGYLVFRYLGAIDQHRWLAGFDREENPRPSPAGRNFHQPRQVLVEATQK
jgi:hypothetical protein